MIDDQAEYLLTDSSNGFALENIVNIQIYNRVEKKNTKKKKRKKEDDIPRKNIPFPGH